MILLSVFLQHFRSYTQKKFDLSSDMTIVVGPNTAGKTNLSEAIHLLLIGKSFRAKSDIDMIAFGQDVARVQGLLEEESEKEKIEVIIASAQATGGRFSKKFLVNGVGKSRNTATDFLPLVLFRPEELEIITDGPALRRDFLDSALEIVSREYKEAKHTYDRSLRQRNALLRIAQETGRKNREQFDYWNELLIKTGQILTKEREEFLSFINSASQDIFPLQITYDKSTISAERLDQYKAAEVGAGVTLVGPHRDDFIVLLEQRGEFHDVRHFGSRGQQRLCVLQLKMLQIEFTEQKLGKKPLLVLDDIFSELDSAHIDLVLQKVKGMQVILTTTHREFIPAKLLLSSTMIELENSRNA